MRVGRLVSVLIRLNFEHSEGIVQRLKFHVQTVHEIFDLRLRIEHFNALCVCVVAHAVWSWNCFSKAPV